MNSPSRGPPNKPPNSKNMAADDATFYFLLAKNIQIQETATHTKISVLRQFEHHKHSPDFPPSTILLHSPQR